MMACLTIFTASSTVQFSLPPLAFKCPPPLKKSAAIWLQGKSSTDLRLTQITPSR